MTVRRWSYGRASGVLIGAVLVVLAGSLPASAKAPTWAATALPAPSPGPLPTSLAAVSCPAITSCVAVGSFTPSTGGAGAFVANLVSGQWLEGALALPGDATDAGLNAVTCLNTSHCVAVGFFDDTTGTHALVETFANGTWSATTGIDPAGATDDVLNGVSCANPQSCAAVGTSASAPLVETLSSGTWTPTVLPILNGSLSGVSCSAVKWCTAVGAINGSTQSPLIEQSQGSNQWKQVAVSGTNTSLNAVSCAAFNVCTAVGQALDQPWVAILTGSGSWAGKTLALPPGGGAGILDAVSCPSTNACQAFGSMLVASSLGNVGVSLAETMTGSKWAPSAPPLGDVGILGSSCTSVQACVTVANAAIVGTLTGGLWTARSLPGPADAQLDSVSCVSATSCLATGTYYDPQLNEHTLVEALTNGSWTSSTMPIPANYLAGPSVSCHGTFCAIVTGSSAATRASATGAWTVTALPMPSGATFLNLASVSCTSAKFCLAVGNPAGSGPGLYAETDNNGTWTASVVPEPADATFGNMQSVDCQSKTACTAVGSGGSQGIESLVESLTGTAWTATQLPVPSGATYAQLTGVSCETATNCVAVGASFGANGGVGNGLVESLAGGIWTADATLPTVKGATGSGLAAVSCPSAISCVAVGYETMGNAASPLMLTLVGTTWKLTTFTPPANTVVDSLFSDSCTNFVACTAVGSVEVPWSTIPALLSDSPMVLTKS